MPNTTAFSGTLRILTGLVLLAAALYAGFVARSPWIIVVLGVVYAISFVIGRWQRWKLAAKAGMLKKALAGIPFTIVVQCILVSILFAIGYGIGAMMGRAGGFALFDPRIDVVWPAALCAFATVSGLLISMIETPKGGVASNTPPANTLSGDIPGTGGPEYEVKVFEAPITPQTFYWRSDEAGYEPTPPASPQQISDAEQRLGVILPELLKTLYGVQNGGSVDSLCLVAPGEAMPNDLEHIFKPFSGYDDLIGADRLRTAWEGFLDFGDPKEEYYDTFFVPEAKKLVVLAQWYQETLFLDYNEPGVPRVGFVDFDYEGWSEKVRYWPDFETFFAQLRRYEDVE